MTAPLFDNGAEERIFRRQVLSDSYRSLQSRMDSYRQASAAIFIGVIAAIVTFDSALYRLAIDANALQWVEILVKKHEVSRESVGFLFIICVPFFICLLGLYIIWRHRNYFAEMSSIVYKIETIYNVWDIDLYVSGKPLYPLSFECRTDVAQLRQDRPLIGWRDPAIGEFFMIILAIGLLHMAFYIVYAYMTYRR